MSERARILMAKFENLLSPHADDTATDRESGPWLFGLSQPTALDAHLVVFIARMRDVGRDDLISERLNQYADFAMGLPEWKSVLQGRKTMVGN